MTQNYSNTAVQTALSSSITAATTSILVDSTIGFPAVNFTLSLDGGTASEELVLVTGVAGTTLTVTRGYDGTTAVSHNTGGVVQHVHSAKDFADSRAHEAATTGVHGVSGALVGTTNTQALTNKDMTSATNSFPTTLATLTGAQTLTNKTISAASNTISGVGIIAYKEYNPGTQTDLSTASTTDVDADATNLAVTFTTPTSGRVLVRLTALGEQPTSGGGVWWTIRESTTTVKQRYVTTARAANYDYPGTATFVVTGLAPGSSHTYKWGHYVSTGTSRIRTGGTLGPAVMEVLVLP